MNRGIFVSFFGTHYSCHHSLSIITICVPSDGAMREEGKAKDIRKDKGVDMGR